MYVIVHENASIVKQMKVYVSSFLGFLILVYKSENNVSKQLM